MQRTPTEVLIAFLVWIVLWVGAVAAIYFLGRRREGVHWFWKEMLAHRRAALTIAAVYTVCVVLRSSLGVGELFSATVGGAVIFSQGLIGLAIAYRIAGFEPMPVATAIAKGEQPVRAVVLMLIVGIVAGVVGLFVGGVGMSIAGNIAGETIRTSEAATMLPGDKWLSLFTLLSGAGIGEETPFRLVLLSLVWKLTGRKWLATLAAAVVFALYHLTPITSMYLVFWQFPVAQVFSSALIGLLWGFIFVKRGYETAVLGHTMSDWIAVMFFM